MINAFTRVVGLDFIHDQTFFVWKCTRIRSHCNCLYNPGYSRTCVSVCTVCVCVCVCVGVCTLFTSTWLNLPKLHKPEQYVKKKKNRVLNMTDVFSLQFLLLSCFSVCVCVCVYFLHMVWWGLCSWWGFVRVWLLCFTNAHSLLATWREKVSNILSCLTQPSINHDHMQEHWNTTPVSYETLKYTRKMRLWA